MVGAQHRRDRSARRRPVLTEAPSDHRQKGDDGFIVTDRRKRSGHTGLRENLTPEVTMVTMKTHVSLKPIIWSSWQKLPSCSIRPADTIQKVTRQ